MNLTAFIFARGGSKRIPNKNIRNFCGKPIMHWPINILKKCSFIDDILVSTDNEDIANFAKSLNVKVPFGNPQKFLVL